MFVSLFASALLTLALGSGPTCPAGIPTLCGPDQTCCPTFESLTGYGCCNYGADAVCCPLSSTTQGCCPAGTQCVLTGPYDAICEPSGGGANLTALHVCTPGAALPPSASDLPSVITIGDSVSEGYQPPLAAILNTTAFVQHSPHSDGGGADDVFNGVACQENFLRTAMFEQVTWTGI